MGMLGLRQMSPKPTRIVVMTSTQFVEEEIKRQVSRENQAWQMSLLSAAEPVPELMTDMRPDNSIGQTFCMLDRLQLGGGVGPQRAGVI
jgi:hypothetical protein